MATKRRNTANSPNYSPTPKQGVLVSIDTNDLNSATGQQFGYAAHLARLKTQQSILEFSRYVYLAYNRFYEPWKQVGRKSKDRLKEAKIAHHHWEAFLIELGWEDFPRYHKQIRDLAAIGKRFDQLKPHTQSLPNSVSALSTLCKKSTTDAQFTKVLNLVTPELTAAGAKKLVATGQTRSQLIAQLYAPKPKFDVINISLVLDDSKTESHAAVLALLSLLNLEGDTLPKGSTVKDILASRPKLKSTVAKFVASLEMKALVGLHGSFVSNSPAFKSALKKAHKENQVIREQLASLHRSSNKKLDYSKLKV